VTNGPDDAPAQDEAPNQEPPPLEVDPGTSGWFEKGNDLSGVENKEADARKDIEER
jgi:hypothetical protein